MTTRFYPPGCLLEVFTDYLFPTINFSDVAFFSGIPWPLDRGWPQTGITVPEAGFSSQINVYLREGWDNPCDFDSFLNMAHELVHVLQIQSSFGGGRIPGYWEAEYVGCVIGWTWNGWFCDNQFEKEAYDYANGCPDGSSKGLLRTCLSVGKLSHAPCDCSDPPWFKRYKVIPNSGITFYDQLGQLVKSGGACPDAVKSESTISPWKCLLSPWALLGALFVGIVLAIGSILDGIWKLLYAAFSSVFDFFGRLLGLQDAKSWIWFTAFDGTEPWFTPDVPVTRNNLSTRTSEGPALAEFNGRLYMAYRSSGSDDLWYNVFDGTSWLPDDIKISQGGHTQTSAARRWRSSTAGSTWPTGAAAATTSGTTSSTEPAGCPTTSRSPRAGTPRPARRRRWRSSTAGLHGLPEQRQRRPLVQRLRRNQLAARRHQDLPGRAHQAPARRWRSLTAGLYMAYRSSGSDDLWYNVFDGTSWLPRRHQDQPVRKHPNREKACAGTAWPTALPDLSRQ